MIYCLEQAIQRVITEAKAEAAVAELHFSAGEQAKGEEAMKKSRTMKLRAQNARSVRELVDYGYVGVEEYREYVARRLNS